MKQTFASALIGLGLLGLMSTPAQAATSEDTCALYARIGGTMSDFMMPLTVKNFVEMMSGKDNALMAEMTSSLITGIGPDHLATMMTLKGDESELIGQAAGTVMMELLMTGAATTPAEIETNMRQTCNSIGAKTLIANQRAAVAAQSRNVGK